MSRRGLKNYALSIRFPNILKVVSHGKYIAIIKLGGREKEKQHGKSISATAVAWVARRI